RRSETVKDVSPAELDKAYTTGGTDPQEADAIFRLTVADLRRTLVVSP
ncbi:MAG: hypothetical protein IPM84_20300, partial [Anaerolineae bacterium]|nr:hypothetical protein [Anaerolineae bacterium]